KCTCAHEQRAGRQEKKIAKFATRDLRLVVALIRKLGLIGRGCRSDVAFVGKHFIYCVSQLRIHNDLQNSLRLSDSSTWVSIHDSWIAASSASSWPSTATDALSVGSII